MQVVVAAVLMSGFAGNVTAQSQTDQTQADAALADFVATYEPQLTPEQVTLFRLSQTVWDASRQADCAFKASNVAGGSAYPEVVSACLDDAAQARLEALQALAQCGEGDLACPAPKSE